MAMTDAEMDAFLARRPEDPLNTDFNILGTMLNNAIYDFDMNMRSVEWTAPGMTSAPPESLIRQYGYFKALYMCGYRIASPEDAKTTPVTRSVKKKTTVETQNYNSPMPEPPHKYQPARIASPNFTIFISFENVSPASHGTICYALKGNVRIFKVGISRGGLDILINGTNLNVYSYAIEGQLFCSIRFKHGVASIDMWNNLGDETHKTRSYPPTSLDFLNVNNIKSISYSTVNDNFPSVVEVEVIK